MGGIGGSGVDVCLGCIDDLFEKLSKSGVISDDVDFLGPGLEVTTGPGTGPGNGVLSKGLIAAK